MEKTADHKPEASSAERVGWAVGAGQRLSRAVGGGFEVGTLLVMRAPSSHSHPPSQEAARAPGSHPTLTYNSPPLFPSVQVTAAMQNDASPVYRSRVRPQQGVTGAAVMEIEDESDRNLEQDLSATGGFQ